MQVFSALSLSSLKYEAKSSAKNENREGYWRLDKQGEEGVCVRDLRLPGYNKSPLGISLCTFLQLQADFWIMTSRWSVGFHQGVVPLVSRRNL